MKKMLALVLSLMLCLTAAAALAETIGVEPVELNNGLCFPAPADWTQMELDEEDREEGYVLMTMDEITGRCMALVVEDMGEGVTTADVAEILQSSSDYAGANLVTNGHGMEFALYALADQTMVSYAFVDEDGQMYNFSFLNAEGKKISGDTALLELVDTCMADTRFAEAEEEAQDPAAPVMAGSIPLETYTLDKTISIALPADWTSQELSEVEKDAGYVIVLLDEKSQRCVMVTANELGDITTAQLAEGLAEDSDYATARLMTNSHGMELVLYVVEDQTAGGYCFVDGDGWLYNFMFMLDGEKVMTNDADLAQLVSDCMENTYYLD
ncbi:MAG: hypothetical protein IJ041_00555 [Clostridia bacterium]|nr:hypothetical protein [Clostridia bacterium]